MNASTIVGRGRRARFALLALAASTALGVPLTASVAAQTLNPGEGGSQPDSAYISPPAEKLMVSPGGVDMRSQQYVYKSTDLALGTAAAGARLDLERTSLQGVPAHVSPFGNFSHNFDIMLTERRVDLTKGDYKPGAGVDYRFGVRMGGLTDTFDLQSNSGGTPVQTSRTSTATLAYTGGKDSADVLYTYTSVDGTQVLFRPLGYQDCAFQDRCAYASVILYPDGTRLDLAYEAQASGPQRARLRSVTSNRGYALLFEYGYSGSWWLVSKACLVNLSSAPQPADGACPTTALSSAAYSYASVPLPLPTTANNGQTSYPSYPFTMLASYAANGEAPETYGYTPTSSTAPLFDMSFTHAGDAQPWLVNGSGLGLTEEGGEKQGIGAQHFADGRAYTYDFFDPSSMTGGVITSSAGGTITDNQGNTVSFDYGFYKLPKSLEPPTGSLDTQQETFGGGRWQMTDGPIRITDQLGRVTTADYCDPFVAANLPASDHDRCVVIQMQSWTDPEGAKTDVTYGPNRVPGTIRRHAKPGSNLPDLVVTNYYDCTYAKLCDKPQAVTDARGATTTYTYDIAHGGVLSELQPAPSNGAARPLKLYTYVQKYAYVKDATGALVAASAPVWLPATATQCQTVAGSNTATCDPAAEQLVTTDEYGADGTADNLLLRGTVVTADGQSRRTCNLYDSRGDRIAQTLPRAGLTACP